MDSNSLTEGCDNIEMGYTFFKCQIEDTYPPWFKTSDLHGTQITSIIQKVNPFCGLNIFMVGKSHKDVVPMSVAKV